MDNFGIFRIHLDLGKVESRDFKTHLSLLMSILPFPGANTTPHTSEGSIICDHRSLCHLADIFVHFRDATLAESNDSLQILLSKVQDLELFPGGLTDLRVAENTVATDNAQRSPSQLQPEFMGAGLMDGSWMCHFLCQAWSVASLPTMPGNDPMDPTLRLPSESP